MKLQSEYPELTSGPAPDDRHAGRLPMSASRYRVALVREEVYRGPSPCLNHPALAARFVWRHLENESREVLLAVFLDQRHHLIGWQRAFTGTLTRVAVEPRPILQTALLSNARSVLIWTP